MKTTLDSRRALLQLLQSELNKRRAQDPKFSQRAFAKQLMINSAALSELLRGKRNLSRKSAAVLLSRLGVTDQEANQVLALFENRRLAKTRKQDRVMLSSEEFSGICQWQHFAILSLVETRSFRSDPAWVADRLGISVEIASNAIQALIKFGLLAPGPEGALLLTGRYFSSPDGVQNEAVRTTHMGHLEIANRSLNDVPFELRDFSSVTMAVDPQRLPKAREMIRTFNRKLSKYLEGGRKLEVYALQVQVFPLSRSDKRS